MASARESLEDFEKFIPPSAWSEDPKAHYLLLDLPGFIIEKVKLEVDNSGHMIVSGEKPIHNHKRKYFEQKYKLPDNADVDNISGQFEGEILNVTVPKKQVAMEKKQIGTPMPHGRVTAEEHVGPDEDGEKLSNPDGEVGHDLKQEKSEDEKKRKSEERIKKWEEEGGQFGMTIKFIKKNKMIFITAIVAYTLGVLVTKKSQSNGK